MTSGLLAEGVCKRFGGVAALDSVTLAVLPGQVHGLIGPNGSGKTTLLNLLSGYYQPDAGRVCCDDQTLSGRPVQLRPTLGVSRTFQKPRLLPSMTVLDNAMLGYWPQSRAGFGRSLLGLGAVWREERAARDRAMDLLAGVGLNYAAHRPAGVLEHAEQRFLEIARGLMVRPRFLMLDEPAGGLTHGEIDHLANLIDCARQAGVGVLLVEHHTDFVFRISDTVTTLDLGRVIAAGAPDAVRAHPDVIRVYLGS